MLVFGERGKRKKNFSQQSRKQTNMVCRTHADLAVLRIILLLGLIDERTLGLELGPHKDFEVYFSN